MLRRRAAAVRTPGRETSALLTFIEVQGTHGVAHDRGELAQVRGAPHQLLHQPIVQVRVPDHALPEDNLLELLLEAAIHCLPGDDHGAGLHTCRKKRVSRLQGAVREGSAPSTHCDTEGSVMP